jgi:uncharacterized repeat protein (TIGR01451 family)
LGQLPTPWQGFRAGVAECFALVRSKLLSAVAITSCLLAGPAHAVGTLAGTSVPNQAQVSYTLGGVPAQGVSNTVTFQVAEIVDLNITLQSSTVAVASGDTNRTLLFTLTNTGNGAETFPLTLDNLVAGDDFDPVAATAAIYFDTDGNGTLSVADTAYVAGGNDPLLAPDAGIAVLLVNDMPPALADGAIGRSQLLAHAATGTGVPGTIFAGQGGGGTDAVVGVHGGQARVAGQYQVSESQVTLTKSASVAGAGGTGAIPGAQITYQIVVTMNGSAPAANFVFTDAIPAGTTFAAGSLLLNGVTLTDAADADAGEFQAGATPGVRVSLGNLMQAAGPQTVAFTVTIN